MLEEVYRTHPNYRVIYGTSTSRRKRAVIFFSGNGLYYPNTPEEFQKTVIEADRFEWQNIAQSCKADFFKIIFVRDIKKTWYVEGISATHSTIESVHRLLAEERVGVDELICVGNSAGGFAAMLFGTLLKAKVIYSISGFFVLDKAIYTDSLNPMLIEALLKPDKFKWFDIRSLIEESDSTIVHFYPIHSEEDIRQISYLKACQQLVTVAIDSSIHGSGPSGRSYPSLFTFSSRRLRRMLGLRKEIITVSELDRLIDYQKLNPFMKILFWVKKDLKKRFD
jgi:pimeloyl-ACP methyl ester carboxylesterase